MVFLDYLISSPILLRSLVIAIFFRLFKIYHTMQIVLNALNQTVLLKRRQTIKAICVELCCIIDNFQNIGNRITFIQPVFVINSSFFQGPIM